MPSLLNPIISDNVIKCLKCYQKALMQYQNILILTNVQTYRIVRLHKNTPKALVLGICNYAFSRNSGTMTSLYQCQILW